MAYMLDYVTKFFHLVKISDIVDMSLIAFVVYMLLTSIRETRAMQLLKGIAIIFIVLHLSALFNLTTTNYLLRNVMQVGLFALLVVFQPELRSFLEKMGRSKIGRIIDIASGQGPEEHEELVVNALVDTAVVLSRTKTGALIVLERETRLGDVIQTGCYLNAEISSALLQNIFAPNTPLHDGAVILRGDRIHTAGCLLPLTSNPNLSRELGTRHRAAIGITEASDAVTLVVSEETGKISIAMNGSITRNLDKDSLKKALSKLFITADPKESLNKVRFWKGANNA